MMLKLCHVQWRCTGLLPVLAFLGIQPVRIRGQKLFRQGWSSSESKLHAVALTAPNLSLLPGPEVLSHIFPHLLYKKWAKQNQALPQTKPKPSQLKSNKESMCYGYQLQPLCYHRTTEWVELEGTLQGCWVTLPAMNTHSSIRCSQPPSLTLGATKTSSIIYHLSIG